MRFPSSKAFLGVIPQTSAQASASFIFLHGSGHTGRGLREWVRFVLSQDLTFPHIKIVYPTAPVGRYTAQGDTICPIWFDRREIAFEAVEDEKSTNSGCSLIKDLISQELASGIPINRIMIGGFSMGGSLSLHVAYRFQLQLAGCVCLSAYLNKESAVYNDLKSQKANHPPLLMCHGQKDPMVKYDWAKSTFTSLQKLGVVDSKFHTFPNRFHDIDETEIQLVRDWINKRIPQ